jgi:1-acyl-sn-glycerol-3-phosphate acyltransferase
MSIQLPRRSEFYWGWFVWYLPRYLRKNFHAVRLAKRAPLPELAGPLVVVLNHPSWWDPLVAALLARRFPGRTGYAPFDAQALRKYRIFERLGFYPVEQGTPRGAIEFLRVSLALLEKPNTALWITAQGRFADPRERPIVLKPGVGHLVQRLTTGHVLPLALEYPFWEERFPEALAHFGDPLPITSGPTAAEWLERIAGALQATQDALREAAVARDPARFETILGGSVGVGGIYDWWRRWTEWLRGERFSPAHGKETRG